MIIRTCLLLLAILLAACSGAGGGSAPAAGGATATATSRPPQAAPTAGGGQSAPPSIQAGSTTPPLEKAAGFRASGARVRIANLYHNASMAPGPIDVYGDLGPGSGDSPLVSVAYGTMSDWFDPGILDDQRNAFISFYPSGLHDATHEIGTQSETLKGDERITIFVAAGQNQQSSQRFGGRWRTVFEISTLNPLPIPPAGQAAVILDTLALDAIPGAKDGYVYVSAGGACLDNLAQDNGSAQPISAYTTSTFAIPATAVALSFHPDGNSCSGKGVFDDVQVTLSAGQRAYVELFSPDGTTIRSLVVPIEP